MPEFPTDKRGFKPRLRGLFCTGRHGFQRCLRGLFCVHPIVFRL